MSVYKIKPLVWDEYGAGNRLSASAWIEPFKVSYNVGRLPRMAVWEWQCSVDEDRYHSAASYEAAKHAAQQDWERRLGDVLEVVEE